MAYEITSDNIAFRIIDVLASELSRFDARIEKFRVQFAEDPAYALDWSESVFTAAASREVYLSALKRLRRAARDNQMSDVVALRAYAESLAFSQARSGNSTSQTANLMARAKGAAWVELIEIIDSFVRAAELTRSLQPPDLSPA